MSKVSIIVPSRNELFLPQTINDLLVKAGGDVEVIVILDGYWPREDTPNFNWEMWLKNLSDERVIHVHRGSSMGMRAGINAGASIAHGKFLMKCDAHCMFAEGYDEVLQADCDKDWVVIPSRYSLDYDAWAIANTGKARVDYHFLSCPWTNPDGFSMHGQVWNSRARERLDPQYSIDDEMSFQGSCWFMHSDYFNNFLGGLSEEGYGTFTQEPQEIGMKVWLGGGSVKVNKLTWYAHLHKGKTFGRGYRQDRNEIAQGHEYSAKFWTQNRWNKRVHNFEWLIDKFWPVPTWPVDWKSRNVP